MHHAHAIEGFETRRFLASVSSPSKGSATSAVSLPVCVPIRTAPLPRSGIPRTRESSERSVENACEHPVRKAVHHRFGVRVGSRSAEHRAQSRLLQLARGVVLVNRHVPAVVVLAHDLIEVAAARSRARKAETDFADAALRTGGNERHPPHAVLHAGEVGIRTEQE